MMENRKSVTYEEAVEYIERLPRFRTDYCPEDTRRSLRSLGNPERSLNVIHVAGTNGKGSTCSYLKSILEAAGKRVAMFTSPHLVDIRERFFIGKEMVSREAFCKAFLQVHEVLEIREGYYPTFFEYLFLMAVLIFAEEKTDYCILETGLGGRLDSTNSIDNPILCIITKIGYDHMEYLGNTLAQIAEEKAGIIKQGVPVVYWKEKKEADTVIEKKAKSLSSPCISVSKDLVDLNFFDDKRIDFSYKSRYYGYVGFEVNTKAHYQTENAALAIAAAEQVLGDDMLHHIQAGISAMHWEGRMEEVLPNVFLDGAHNEDGIDAFLNSVKYDSCKGKRSLLFSVVHDKQYQKMADKIQKSGLFHRIYTAPIDSSRSISTEELEALFHGGGTVIRYPSPERALEAMLNDREADDYLYIAGSLYLIGQLKKWLRGVV